ARTVRSAVGVGRTLPAIDDMAINERRAAAGDDVIAFGLIVVRNGARNGIRRRICHLLSTRDGLGIAPPGGRRGRRVPSGGAMNDAQLHTPAVADIDNPGILVTGPLRLFRGADLVYLALGDDGSSRRVSRPGLGVDRHRNQNRSRKQNFQCSVFHCVPPEHVLAPQALLASITSSVSYGHLDPARWEIIASPPSDPARVCEEELRLGDWDPITRQCRRTW